MKLLSLRAGRLGLDLAPQAGGAIARFTADASIDLLRPTKPDAIASGRGQEFSFFSPVAVSRRTPQPPVRFRRSQVPLETQLPRLRPATHCRRLSAPLH